MAAALGEQCPEAGHAMTVNPSASVGSRRAIRGAMWRPWGTGWLNGSACPEDLGHGASLASNSGGRQPLRCLTDVDEVGQGTAQGVAEARNSFAALPVHSGKELAERKQEA